MKKLHITLPLLEDMSLAMRGGSLLNTSYNNEDEIPSEYLPLFSQQGDKWILTGVAGLKTDADILRLQESLRKERDDHKATKAKLSGFNGLSAEEVQAKLDRIEELEAAAAGKIDETKLNEMVEARIRTRTAPLERKINLLEQDVKTKEEALAESTKKDKTRTIHDQIRKAAKAAKLRESAIEDALVLGERILDVDENNNVVTRDNVGVTPGVSPEVWLTEQQQTRPHWWPESVGAGASGGNGKGGTVNPFTFENWNMTEQGRLVRENRSKAEQMAKAAGTTIGGFKPAARKA